MRLRRPPVRSLVRRGVASSREFRPLGRTVLREVFESPAPPPSAFARFGEGSWIVPPSNVIGADSIAVGAGVVVLEHSTIRVLGADPGAPRLVLHDGVRLTRFVSIVCEVGILIEEGVASSDCITILDTWRDMDPHREAHRWPEPAPVHIERGSYLGYGCTVGPGVTVGAGAFVGEGAVVVEDVPAHAVVYGNPARVTRQFDPVSGVWEGPRWP